MLGRPAHKPERNRIGEPPSATVSNPKLTNFNATNSTDLFPAPVDVRYVRPVAGHSHAGYTSWFPWALEEASLEGLPTYAGER